MLQNLFSRILISISRPFSPHGQYPFPPSSTIVFLFAVNCLKCWLGGKSASWQLRQEEWFNTFMVNITKAPYFILLCTQQTSLIYCWKTIHSLTSHSQQPAATRVGTRKSLLQVISTELLLRSSHWSDKEHSDETQQPWWHDRKVNKTDNILACPGL